MIAATAIALARKFTPAVFAGLLYVGNFKTAAAQGLSLTDPTFIVLALCCSGLLIECLVVFSGRERSTLAARFAGQSHGVLLFLLFVLIIAVSDLYTAAPESGLIKLEHIAVFATVAFFAPFILFKQAKDLNQFLTTCVGLSLALSIRNLVELFHPTAAVLAGNKDITRIGDGELIATTIVILIYHRHFGRRKSLQLACILILAVGLAASAARSAAFSLFLTLIVTSVVLRSHSGPWLRKKMLLGGMVVVVATAAVLLIGRLPAAREKLKHKEDELGHLMKGSFLAGGTAEQRMRFYRQSLVAISKKPLLGWGVGGWSAFFLGMDRKEFPHNFILESAVEQGLIGCASLLAFLIATGSALRKVISRSGAHYGFLLPALLLPVFTGQVSGGLDSRSLWFWCGTIFAVSRMIHNQRLQPPACDGASIHQVHAPARAFTFER
jgi:O-antigen ligase